jgi:Flp pilus assembly protein TadG
MTTSRHGRPRATARAFRRARRGAAVVEFALVALPFLYILLVIIQMGLYYMTQAALDAGVNQTANNLRNTFNTATTPTLPTGAALKSSIVTYSGGLPSNTGGLAVDLRALANLGSAVVPITDGTVDSVTTNVPIVLRAQTDVVAVAPGFSWLTTVQSAAILRFGGF